MNSTRPFTRSANRFFKPALDYLNSSQSSKSRKAKSPPQSSRRKNSASSLDDTDHSDREHYAAMESGRSSHSSKNSFSELQAPMPLIDISSGSRASSPYPRTRSAAQSEDEDEDYELENSIRPLVSNNVGAGSRGRGLWRQGGLAGFFFATWIGWQTWVGLLVLWFAGCSFGLLLMNRFIMLTGVYKFAYPLTWTYLQLILTHSFLVGFSSFTRFFGGALRRIGFGAAVSPSYPAAPTGGAFRGSSKRPSIVNFGRWFLNGQGGIAGGGLFEFETKVALQVLPVAVVFVVKVLLSNISFAYASLPIYQLARIGTIPVSIVLSCVLQKENHSGSTLSSALIATLNLLFATLSRLTDARVTWESIIAGVFSSFFVALYPNLLLRTYRILVSDLVPQGDILTGYPAATDDPSASGNREETRAYYRTLHYISLLSILILTPIVFFSGELLNIYRNIYHLDVSFFWLMIFCGALGSWSVFVSTLLLVKATSPLTATFVSVPRGAFQLVVLEGRMPAQGWVAIVFCWVASVWFGVARRDEGRMLDRLRLEGR